MYVGIIDTYHMFWHVRNGITLKNILRHSKLKTTNVIVCFQKESRGMGCSENVIFFVIVDT